MTRRTRLGAVAALTLIGLVGGGGLGYAADEAKTADLLVKLLKAGRMVVSDHQDLINDAGKGDKGFTPQYFEEKWIAKYKETAKIDLSKPPAGEAGRLLTALLESGKEVVGEAQPLINKPGIGFKGFLPALWGRKAGEKFGQKTGIRLKQTSLHYRFAGNKPDDFESEILKQFSDPGYPKGKEYVKTVAMEGKQVMRYLSPEYAAKSCLACHGTPAGEKDITGMKKEGYKEGDLAGAISVVMPVK